MNTPESYGFPEPPVEPDPLLTNDLYDTDDGCLNRLVLIGGLIDLKYGKKAIQMTITTEDCTGVDTQRQAILKLPPGALPDDIDFAPGHAYALVLARVRE